MTWRPDKKQSDDLVKRVLSRTSGSACAKAQGLLPDWVAGRLTGMDGDLVRAHAEHCETCQNLTAALGWLEQALPEMARLDPGLGFTRRVLAATSGAPAPQWIRVPVPEDGFAARLRQWLEKQILRPNFAAEVAYIAAVVLVLLTAVPGSPLEGTPGKARRIIQAGPTELTLVRELWPGLAGRIDEGRDRLARSTTGAVAERVRETVDALQERAADTEPARQEFKSSIARGTRLLGEGRLGEALVSLDDCLVASKEIWRLWRNQDD